jgi:hypothetical protein
MKQEALESKDKGPKRIVLDLEGNQGTIAQSGPTYTTSLWQKK